MIMRKTIARRFDAEASGPACSQQVRSRRERELPFRNLRKGDFARSEHGGSLVEFALALPILFALVFGLIELCLALYSHAYISELAREGARYAIVHGSTCVTSGGSSCTATAAQVQAHVSGIGLPNLGGGKITPLVTYPGGNEAPGSLVQVKITYAFPYNIPFVSRQTLSMTSTSSMTILQ